MKLIKLYLIVALVGLLGFCAQKESSKISIQKEKFGEMSDGEVVNSFTVENSQGMEIKIIEYGGILVSAKVPDKNGNLDDVVLGYDNLKDYLNDNANFGAIIGRFANRIKNGEFTLDGKKYKLPTNTGSNHIHGGTKGFDDVVWKGKKVSRKNGKGVQLKYVSEDGEQGYPGKLNVTVTYILTNNNEISISYQAKTNKPTILNLTNHSYFNLAGEGNQSILDHKIRIQAKKFTPANKNLIPTGEIRSVTGTPMDFRDFKKIGKDIDTDYKQLEDAGGYDHNWVLKKNGEGLAKVATLKEDSSGRKMQVHTTQPGMQFYTGNFLDSSIVGKSGKPYPKNSGLCLETQHYPDSPHHDNFPSTVLRPGEKFTSKTIYKFMSE